MIKNTLLLLLLAISVLFSCSEKETIDPDTISIKSGGVFITNEGNFSTANSSLSYYYPETFEISNNLFYKANNVPLGDVAQSITINNNMIYLVINNSGLVYGVNRETLEYEGKINGLISPREMIFIDNNKAYISDLYSTEITVANPNTFEITGSIELRKSSDCMVKSGSKIFAANWSMLNQTKLNNTVMVIDSENDMLVDSIIVGIEPNSMATDKDGSLWVLCSGGFMNNEVPTLWKINIASLEILKTYTVGEIMQSPDNLCINGSGDSLYFLNSGVYSMSIYDQVLPNNAIISESSHNYYSLGIDPKTSEIYISDALNYNQNGVVYRYNSTGEMISSFDVGIIPGSFGFN